MAFAGSTTDAKLANAKALMSVAASVAATVMVVRSVTQEFLPPDLHSYIFGGIRNFFSRFSSQLTMVIDELHGFDTNQIYEAAETYLPTIVSPATQRLKVSKPEKEENITTTMESNEEITDTFNGVKLRWIFVCTEVEKDNIYNPRSPYRSMVRSFELSFHKKHREMVLKSYLPYVLNQAKLLKQQSKTVKIFAVDYNNMYGSISDLWIPTNLDHPSTFDKLALDSEIKDFILKDLERFLQRKEYYHQVGKAWKRGYLLYGPPGTGKSSLVAAMANFLKFDVYDLELTQVQSNQDLRKLLMGMANRSILVIEDIDCTVEFQDRTTEPAESSSPRRERTVTLSGLLNFLDGLWSSCGNERIFIFTTNHKEKLDEALLRPGRMDVHVHMSYCNPCGFRQLASNYLGIKDHKLFSEIEESILTAKATPAEVAEQLLKGDEPDSALNSLIEFLKSKKIQNEEAERKIVEAESESEEKQKEERKIFEAESESQKKQKEERKIVEAESESQEKQEEKKKIVRG